MTISMQFVIFQNVFKKRSNFLEESSFCSTFDGIRLRASDIEKFNYICPIFLDIFLCMKVDSVRKFAYFGCMKVLRVG